MMRDNRPKWYHQSRLAAIARQLVALWGVLLALLAAGCMVPVPVPIAPAPTATVAPTATPLPVPTRFPTAQPAIPTPRPTADRQPFFSPPDPAARPDGWACLGTAGYGLVCVDAEGVWQQYTRANSALPTNYPDALAVCGEQIVIAHRDGVTRFDGQTFQTTPGDFAFRSPEGVACDRFGRYWVAHYEGVTILDGGEQYSYPASLLATGENATDLVRDVQADQAGNIVVLTVFSVARFDGESWTIFQGGQGWEKRRFLYALAFDGNGDPWAAHSQGVLHYIGDGVWADLPGRAFYSAEMMRFDPFDRLWVGHARDGLAVRENGSWTAWSGPPTLSAPRINALAFDGLGRLWVATPYGLNLWSADQQHAWRMADSPLPTNDLRSLAVVGNGPPVAPPVAQPAGTLQGQLVRNGEPLAGATVEICVYRLFDLLREAGRAPCDDQPFVRDAQTDREGRFRFGEVPPGLYALSAQVAGEWFFLKDTIGIASAWLAVRPQEVTDVGVWEMGTGIGR
jgi:hypothetical protein